ncbi:allophanate hydrolase subunit 1 [Actinospica durhamensis]|uniref:Allophanate hydrolase subunit 1 n=2 Tax=Actinospica durhamensis TaxID=1508375 RepID=A0A941EWM5_9ACTN|nr:allophanate hydrolase subunit 1 [Actinospica durhamensis]
MGSRALLVELDPRPDGDGPADPEPAQLYRTLTRTPPAGALEYVPAARTVLVRFDPALTSAAALRDRIGQAVSAATDADVDGHSAVEAGSEAAILEIPVRYDGADLDEVARISGLSPDEVVARHCGGLYTVAFCGFAPGFGYLTGLDDALRLPRRAVPRTRVPAGSVAIADVYTSVYPHSSPGGWHLLGRTETAVWDVTRQPPALLEPGTRVRFVSQDASTTDATTNGTADGARG